MSSTPSIVPTTVEEVLRADYEFKPEVVEAVKAFRRAKPWRGSPQERQAKFTQFNADLARAIGIAAPTLAFNDLDPMVDPQTLVFPSEMSRCDRRTKTIYLIGKLSVVTYLHLFMALTGANIRTRFEWSLNLFARFFPISYASCRHVGPFLLNDHVPAHAA
jgi:hypothetical protein